MFVEVVASHCSLHEQETGHRHYCCGRRKRSNGTGITVLLIKAEIMKMRVNTVQHFQLVRVFCQRRDFRLYAINTTADHELYNSPLRVRPIGVRVPTFNRANQSINQSWIYNATKSLQYPLIYSF